MITQPKPGDYILVHIPGRGGTAIQLLQWMNGTGSDGFEHAAVYIGNDQCIEMSGGGIRVNRVADYIRRPHRWSSGILNPSDEQRTAIVAASNHYLELDVDYSWEDYAALTAHRFHIPTPRLKKYIEDTGHMICSQLVDRTWTDGGFHLFDDHRWHGYVTPGHLNQRLGGT